MPSARRPDPMPWVPAPSGEGEGAPTGEVTALAPGGRHSAARATFLEFWRYVLAGEEAAVVQLLAPAVGWLNRPGTLDRAEAPRVIRRELDRTGARLSELSVEELVDAREIRVREVEDPSESRRPSPVVREGDLVVSAPRLGLPAGTTLRPFEDRGPLSLVMRHESGRFTIVAVGLF